MEEKVIKLYRRDGLYVKKEDVSEKNAERLKEKYTFMFYDEKGCARCEYKPERHTDVCDNCANFTGGHVLYKEERINGKRYVKLPIGDTRTIRKFFERTGPVKMVNMHPWEKTKFARLFKFTGTLRPEQEEAVKAMMDRRRGVLKAPPRSGKTVMGTALSARLGVKTMIMAAQREWLDGFHETFVGSESQAPLTNLKPSRIGYCKKYEDFLKYDVCLVTCQTFQQPNGRKLLARVCKLFGLIIIDEVHGAAAPEYLKTISKLNVQYFIGLSGTPNRKDRTYVLVEKMLGPIIYTMVTEKLTPTVKLVRTGHSKNLKGGSWPTLVNSLESDPKRLKLIAEHAVKDIKDGHMLLIPMARVKVVRALALAINKLYGEDVAVSFDGAMKKPLRKQYIQDARSYKVKCIVGSAKLISVGVNIPRASAIYDTTMSSNIENCEQRVNRVLTPYADKPPPLLRMFLDETNVRKSCMRNEWNNCIQKIFKPHISPADKLAMKAYLNSSKSSRPYGDQSMDLF